MKKRLFSILLICAIVLSPLSITADAAEARYGSIPILIGYADVDYMAEQVLAEISIPETGDRERIQAVYDWIIYNCERYEWDGTYYFDEDEVLANAEPYAMEMNDLLAEGGAVIRPEWAEYYGMDIEDISYDSNYYIAVFAYEMMMTRTGNCAHYSALLALLLGHLGYDCRLIPGEFINGDGSQVEHKWNYVLVDGEYYWLDVRIDHSIYTSVNHITHDYFMVSDTVEWAESHDWYPSYSNLLAEEAPNIVQQYNNVGHTHELEPVAASDPNCTDVGYVEHYECKICGSCYLDAEGEQWVSAAEVTIPALGHDWENWVVLKESTSSETGLEERICRRDPEHIQTRETPKLQPPFKDVKTTDYFFEPVLWAVKNGITSGVSSTRFAPSDSCTRAQVVTFLWRAAGEPKPTSTRNPFKDVKSTAYYYDAVLWAVEKGITTGMSATSFGPNNPCTRGQVVTFLHRAAGAPAPAAGKNPFRDVKDSDFFYDAVLWAVENGITTGMSATSFSPGNTCTRGQVVTFLYRAEK